MAELNLSLTTLRVLAWSKVLLSIYGALIIFFIAKNKKPLIYVITTTLTLVVFYLVFSWPLQKMWWGSVGDELFVSGFLGKVLLGHPGQDFYYGWLPNFYPPLYFWVTGLLSRPLASNAIVAAKIGVTGVLGLWFLGSYGWQKLFWRHIQEDGLENRQSMAAAGWFWFLLPSLYFLMLDFDTIILKPYEALTALGCIILTGLLAKSFYHQKWSFKYYLFFGLSAGFLFLTYYFWWFILIPTLFILALLTKNKFLNIKRLIIFGLIILVVSSIFWLPLAWSYLKYGLENGQAIFFVPQDFFTFAPWRQISLQSLMYILGLSGLLIFYKKSFVRASLVTLLVCGLYQLLNIIYFLTGHRPMQASKAFWFLGTAAFAVGLTYLAIYIYQQYLSKWPNNYRRGLLVFVFILLLFRAPFVYFVDDPVVLAQIEKDLIKPQQTIQLAGDIKNIVPDYNRRTWLSSGSMELGAYLPLSYYIAPNIHFSHQASLYSQRLAEIKAMSRASSSAEFMGLLDKGYPDKIDSLLFYYNPKIDKEGYYALYFWQDNFPNGGKDLVLYLPQNLITEDSWQEVYHKNNWLIFLRK
jgi:hypothetical protein